MADSTKDPRAQEVNDESRRLQEARDGKTARTIQLYGSLDAKRVLEGGKRGAFKEAASNKGRS